MAKPAPDRGWPVGWQAHMILRGGRPSYFRGKERKGCTSSDRFAAAVVAAASTDDDGDAGDGDGARVLRLRDRE